jgi:hypothetical protein
MANYALIGFMMVAVVLLFTAMVLSAMAAQAAGKDPSNCPTGENGKPDECTQECHKYSMWSALVTGLAVGAIIVIIIVYIYSSRKEMAGHAAGQAAALQSFLGQYATQGGGGIGTPAAPSQSALASMMQNPQLASALSSSMAGLTV